MRAWLPTERRPSKRGERRLLRFAPGREEVADRRVQPPLARQRRILFIWEQAIEQTGGYFYWNGHAGVSGDPIGGRTAYAGRDQ
jgi:hypothetical protein